MNNLKSNYVVIIRNGEKEYDEVIALCNNKPFTSWYKGISAITGNFDVKKLEGYEFYDVKSDWNTASGFQDRPL